ncbi:MAG: PilZ domain-containing protein [Terriglobia bacterium]
MGTGTTSAERRATPRYRIQPGSFAYYALGSGAIRDISLGGVFIEDRKSSFSAGTELDLELRLSGEAIVLRGVVKRSIPQVGFGVQFEDFSRTMRERLQQLFRAEHASPGRPKA